MTGCGGCPCSFGTMESYIHDLVEIYTVGFLYLPTRADVCERCSACLKTSLKVYNWRDDLVCKRCYKSKQLKLMDDVIDYIHASGKTSCKICRKPNSISGGYCLKYTEYHESQYNVMTSVCIGIDLDIIMRDIDLCDVLCSGCFFDYLKGELMRKGVAG